MKSLKLLLVAVFAISFFNANAVAEIQLKWDFGKDIEFNAFNVENVHAYGTITGMGASLIVKKHNNFLTRTLEGLIVGSVVETADFFGHEYAHKFVLGKNGANNIKIELDGVWGGTVWHNGNLTDKQRQKDFAGGLMWENSLANYAIKKTIGKKASVSDILIYSIAQLDLSHYFFRNSSNPVNKQESEVWGDIEWYTLTIDPKESIRRAVFDDLRKAALWQGIGVIPAISVGLRYLFTGSYTKMPSWWVNPQAELTDAGVMYSLSGWYKFDSGIIAKGRIGQGNDRVEGENMYSLEIGLLNIPLYRGVTCGVQAGYSDTLEPSTFIGGSVSLPITENVSIGLEGNHYSGYHRRNPVVGSYSDFSGFLKIAF